MTDMDARDLFEAHGTAIYRFAAVLLKHPQDAEDCVQETFLKLLRHLEAGGDTSNIRGWLFTVAAHAARAIDSAAASDGSPGCRRTIDASRRLRFQTKDGRLARARAALAALASRDRLLLALRAQGLSYRDIAAAAGIKPSSVGQLLARAVERWSVASEQRGTAHEPQLLERHPDTGRR